MQRSRRRLRARLFAFAAFVVAGFTVIPSARAAQDLPTASRYGGVGLLDMRTARFMPDGYFSVSAAAHDPDDRIALTFQVLPWAEATFRYSINYAAKAPNNPQRALYDRSFDLKIRLSHEDDYFPEIAVGFQDVIGTGVYAGEYFVASKRFGPIDATIGLGWGRLASCPRTGGGPCSASLGFDNPFGWLADRFKTRRGDISSTGGLPLLTSWFHGREAAVFGGIEYTTPIPRLKMQVEYSSDRYVQEQTNGKIDYGFPVNVGLSYRFWDATDVGIAFMHGRSVTAHLSFAIDPAEDHSLQRLDQPPPFRARSKQALDEWRRYTDTTPTAAPQPRPSNVEFIDLTKPTIALDAPAQPWHVNFTDLSRPPPQAREIETPPPTAQVVQAAPPPTPPQSSGPSTMGQRSAAIEKIRQGLDHQQLEVEGISLSGNYARVVITNTRYLRDAEAVARVARVLSAQAPLDIDTFEISTWRSGVPLTTVTIPRSEIDRIARWESSAPELWHATVLQAASPSPPEFVDRGYPRFNWNVYPMLTQRYFDPDNPIYLGLGLGVEGSLSLFRGFSLDAAFTGSLLDNFNGIKRESDSVLPHVRSDSARYLQDGRYGIANLSANYRFKLSDEIYGRVTAGYLEDMFAGVGGEVLYRPFGERWAIGGDLFAVKQRDFNRLFGFRHYNTVTGHLTFYYEVPWHDLEARIHIGRYLAGDYGATFELMRKFETGIEIGGWVTLTNVSAARFGEGSFDKGIRITIPLEWLVPFGTRGQYSLDMRPIQRDGGQRLVGDDTLYDMIDPSDYGAMMTQWRSVFRP